jgi:DNA-binding SARP family transcriptional activator
MSLRRPRPPGHPAGLTVIGRSDPARRPEATDAAAAADSGSSEPGSGEPGLRAQDDAEAAAGGPPKLRIGLLGSLTVNGQAGALVPAQSQLIVALALNPGGLSNSRLRTLLGADPHHPKPADSLRQLIVRTRRALGQAGDGREWIEHLGHGRYALHPEAWVDWHAFENLTATEPERAGARSPADALSEALGLVRGQPFTGCYYWWLEPELAESVTARIVTTAETLADLALTARDPAAAVRAARIGLAADPSAEQLWRALMRAEHAAGNLAGVRGAWGRCLDVVSEVAADGQPDAATSAVYSELLAR